MVLSKVMLECARARSNPCACWVGYAFERDGDDNGSRTGDAAEAMEAGTFKLDPYHPKEVVFRDSIIEAL